MPYALCERALLSSALHLLLALGISFCNLVFAQEKPLGFRYERRIEFRAESDVTYEVDLGEVPQNRVLDLRFDLCNESGSDRTLNAVASCGCVKLDPPLLEVRKGQVIDLKMVVRTANESPLSFGIAFADLSTGFSFKLHTKGQVKSELEASSSVIKLKASELGKFSFEIRPSFKELGINKLTCLTDRFGGAMFEQQASGTWRVLFDATNKTPPQGVVEDSILLLGELSDGSQSNLRVPITYIDRSKVFPNPLVFRDVSTKPVLVLIVSGALVQQPALQFRIGKSGSFGKPIVPNSVRRRGENSAVIELSVSRELYDEIVNSKEDWFVEVSDSETRGLEISVPIRGSLK